MFGGQFEEGLTFDDVLLVPAPSEVLPKDADISTKLTPEIVLNMPLVSAAMDTVTESQTAIALAQEGGIGIIHKNLTIEAQVAEVLRVKKYEAGIVKEPITVSPNETLATVVELSKQFGVAGFPVVEDGKPVGIITRRDLQFEEDLEKRVSSVMTPKDKLVTAGPDVSFADAKQILHNNRIEKLLLVDGNFNLRGLITVKDLKKVQRYPMATKDNLGRLRVGAAVGVGDKEFERARELLSAGVDAVVVDTAHGHSSGVIEMVRNLRRSYKDAQIIAGNIATKEAALALIDAGANAVKVGVGPGSICTTRIISGCGVPQISAIMAAVSGAKKKGIPIIADGGIKFSGDVVKALAAGANSVMIGSMFAGTLESPGEVVLFQGRSYKVYRGMGSVSAMQKGSRDRYFQAEVEDAAKLVPEGVEGRVPYRGKIKDVLYQLIGGLRSGMGYAGANSLEELSSKAKFIRITAAGLRESHVHDVTITKETPNYSIES